VLRAHAPAGLGRWLAGAALCVAYGSALSATTPFTAPADALVAIPLAVAVGVVARRWRVRRRPAPAGGAGGAGGARPRAGWWTMWAALAGTVLAWELACFARSPRHAYPTLSALLDSLDATRLGKTAAGAAWLALGWYLVRR